LSLAWDLLCHEVDGVGSRTSSSSCRGCCSGGAAGVDGTGP